MAAQGQPPFPPQQPYAQQPPFQQPYQQQPYQQPPTAPQQGWQPQGAPMFPAGMPQVKKGVDLSKISLFSWLVMGGGVLAFIASFLPYYSYDLGSFLGINIGHFSGNAWHGFFGWFGMLLLLAAGVIVALGIFTDFKNPMTPMFTLIGAGAGFLCVLLALFVGFGGPGSYRNVGYWISLVAAVAAAVGAVMLFMDARKNAPAPVAYPGSAPVGYPPAAYPPAGFPPAPPVPPAQPGPEAYPPAPYPPA